MDLGYSRRRIGAVPVQPTGVRPAEGGENRHGGRAPGTVSGYLKVPLGENPSSAPVSLIGKVL